MHSPRDTADPPWQLMTALGTPDSDVLPRRVESVRNALSQRIGIPTAQIDQRVTASVAHLGLVARLVAPQVGAAALGCPIAAPSLDELWWQDRLGGPYPLSIAGPGVDTGRRRCAMETITQAFVLRYGVSEQVLWGNIGSASNSAARIAADARPDCARSAYAAADEILGDARIDGGQLRAGPAFRRRSCCLFCQLTDDRTNVCGDCVLR